MLIVNIPEEHKRDSSHTVDQRLEASKAVSGIQIISHKQLLAEVNLKVQDDDSSSTNSKKPQFRKDLTEINEANEFTSLGEKLSLHNRSLLKTFDSFNENDKEVRHHYDNYENSDE